MTADLESAAGFDRAVESLLVRLRDAAGANATLAELDEPGGRGRAWRLSPAHAEAAEITVATAGHDSVTVEFAPYSRLELGWERGVRPVDVLRELEEVCRSIIAGRLIVTEKLSSGGTKYQLTLTNGEVQEGSTNWLLPEMPWTRVSRVDYRPY